MPRTAAPITFIVSQSQSGGPAVARGAAVAPLPASLARGQRKQAAYIGTQRGAGTQTPVTAVPGDDVVVLHLAGGPALVLHPETARDLMLAQSPTAPRRGATPATAAAPSQVTVPATLRWAGLEQAARARGVLGNVLVTAVEVITGVARDPAADFAAGVVKRFDAQVDAGVYALGAETLPRLKGRARLAKVPAAPDGKPSLVLLHGTFSDSSGTFSKLWTQHPQQVRAIFDRYQGRVYALDHPTLGASPIENALTLVEALPRGARLHLLSHSRGGLVGEVLARVCARPTLHAADLAHFDGAAHRAQRAALRALATTVKRRRIVVERLVRVACPARGTLLASKRLDAYLSVFKWTLELAGIPVLPELVDFLGEVAQRRSDPEKIPGLAAQMPNSPLVQWLHDVDAPIAGALRVIAGDIEGDSVVSWLKTLLADAFYWTDNDLVVQTRSMYGGAPRAGGATFVFDQGGAVSHFNYFSNPRTAEAIANALVQDEPSGFRLIGPLSWRGESSTGVRGAVRGGADGTPPSEKPAVFVLPGILGSNLKVDGERVWLGWRLINGLKRLDYREGRSDRVEPDGPIGMVYDELGAFLDHTHEVIEFAFDWRRPMEDEARRLADAVDAALAARDGSGQPVRLLAHSMGGVLARTMLLERPKVFGRMMARPGARLLMLGTPNGGSWAPMQVLSGDDTFANLLTTFGAPFQDKAARGLMARLPGLLQLQAGLLDQARGLDRTEVWATLAAQDLERLRERSWWHWLKEQLDLYAWGVPPQAVLDRAVALRRRLDAQPDGALAAFHEQMAMVVGRADFTPDGFEIGDEGLVYLDAQDGGDGRVTLPSALLPGVRTWKLDCEHGSLPDVKGAFAAYLELLEKGRTSLSPLTPLIDGRGARGAAAAAPPHLRSRPVRSGGTYRPPESERAVVSRAAAPARPARAARDAALPVTVVNGDLSFVLHPLLIGHYRSLRLTGTEAVINRLIGGAMEDALGVGLYPDAPTEHQVFLNTRPSPEDPCQMPRPKAVVVVGLGEEGKLSAADLVRSVRQATIGWAQRAAARPGAAVQFDLAATLMASGGTGITVGQSAQLVAQGVREANERLHDANQRLHDRQWPLVGHLFLVELYLDRANEAWRALQVRERATPRAYVVSDTVRVAIGSLPRPLDSSYRGADYDFISAVTEKDEHGEALIAYTLDTKRARSEVRGQQTQHTLLRELVAAASNDRNDNPQIGSTLFKLLIPVAMEPFLGGGTDVLLEVDGGTAGIPWELLDTDSTGGDPRPWAIRVKLVRKLRTAAFRIQVRDAGADDGILVIGEPRADPPELYGRLPGARAEANAVVALLGQFAAARADGERDERPAVGEVRGLISADDPDQFGPDAQAVMNALLARDRVWRIVHIAGHGEPPEVIGADPTDPNDPGRPGDPRGVVLSGGTYLGPREIRGMRIVPELVFVNCCYLGARSSASVLEPDGTRLGAPYDRAKFAAGVAEELIQIGVRCVIAAGWAVGDAQAREFATTFYDALLHGQRFIEAVAQAREAARALGGNTWAAYQCYGDPDWVFRPGTGDAQAPARSPQDEFDGVASSEGLTLALRTLEVRSRYQHAAPEMQRAKIRHLEARFAARWAGIGSVAEAFAGAWSAAGDADAAIEWYRRALAANDGSASLRAAEQLGDLRVRQAWAVAERAGDEHAEPTAIPAKPRSGKRRGSAPARGNAERRRDAGVAAARAEIGDALVELQRVADLHPSIERHSLCGAAWKRLAMIEALAGSESAERQAIAHVKTCYQRAVQLARDTNDARLFPPALNLIGAELALGGKGGRVEIDGALLADVRRDLAATARDDADFWSVAGLTELLMYESLARGGLARELAAIDADYDDLYARVQVGWMWRSVYDQAALVLRGYAARAPAAEAKAAAQLQSSLRKKAGLSVGAPEPPRTSRSPRK